jgi:hypothetical protein
MKMCRLRSILLLSVILLVSACATSPPTRFDNACGMLEPRRKWYRAMRKAEKRWGLPISIQLAIMRQESGFNGKAKQPRTRILWILPGPRKSSAYGYAQALKSTWKWYQKSSGNRGADRHDFADAADFISWYGRQSRIKSGISLGDAYHQYLAYHEGQGGFNRGTYKKKKGLQNIAARVAKHARVYDAQLKACEKKLKRRRFLFF